MVVVIFTSKDFICIFSLHIKQSTRENKKLIVIPTRKDLHIFSPCRTECHREQGSKNLIKCYKQVYYACRIECEKQISPDITLTKEKILYTDFPCVLNRMLERVGEWQSLYHEKCFHPCNVGVCRTLAEKKNTTGRGICVRHTWRNELLVKPILYMSFLSTDTFWRCLLRK